jgi:GNAT superfamily N-acetyltransferase
MMIDFFGTTPGLLSLAGAALILILVSVLRRLAARPRARRAGLAAGPAGPPRWLVAAIAAWAAEQAGGGPAGGTAAPSAAAWRPASPGCDAPCGPDPWLAAAGPARRNVGVTK